MRSKEFGKVAGVTGKHATFVPHDSQWFPERFALVCYANGAQRVAMSSQTRRNDRDPVPCLGKCQQGVGRAALDHDVGLEPSETADRVERLANRKTGVRQKQRIRGESDDVDCTATLKPKGWMTGPEKLDWRHRRVAKMSIVGLNGLK